MRFSELSCWRIKSSGIKRWAIGHILIFRRKVVPSSPEPSYIFRLLEAGDERPTVLQNVPKYRIKEAASRFKKTYIFTWFRVLYFQLLTRTVATYLYCYLTTLPHSPRQNWGIYDNATCVTRQGRTKRGLPGCSLQTPQNRNSKTKIWYIHRHDFLFSRNQPMKSAGG
jgi:hypothetical protein